MRNKANCPGMSGNGRGPGRPRTGPLGPEINRAEQSQFPPDGQGWDGASKARKQAPAGIERAKQSQFHQGDIEDKCFMGKGL